MLQYKYVKMYNFFYSQFIFYHFILPLFYDFWNYVSSKTIRKLYFFDSKVLCVLRA
jgi:hypothetical protein